MIDTIYIEDELKDHPRVLSLKARFPDARVFFCGRYTEVFNPNRQNFRLQKERPALIIARKHEGLVLPAPEGYGIGGRNNFYFSHMLNCLYDCRYCFLQGMYRSANYVLFINYEEFESKIKEELSIATGGSATFYSGYDCDSLALESMSGFLDYFLPVFRGLPSAELEIRTKSVRIKPLLETEALPNVIPAYSLSPENVIEDLEEGTPGLTSRVEALAELQKAGWPIGLRFDPVIYQEGFRDHYSQMFDSIFKRIDPDRIHSVSLGGFRLPQKYFNRMLKLYPDEPLFAGPVDSCGGMVRYRPEIEEELMAFCRAELLKRIPEKILFRCEEEESLARS